MTNRSYKKEFLDQDDISFADIRQNMEELNVINTWLGGHHITLQAFKKILGKNKSVSICEIGCGGGDNLLAIEKWCVKHGINVSLTGIDMKPACIAFAKSRTSFKTSVKWITSDYQLVQFEPRPDIIFSSLFCHHFTDEELVAQLCWMKQNSVAGFFINDLQRHFLAYYSIKLITFLFSKSYLVKNDAPLSVLRGFTKEELQELLDKASITNAAINWKWAFRWIIVSRSS